MAEEKGALDFKQVKGKAVQVSVAGNYAVCNNKKGNVYQAETQALIDGEGKSWKRSSLEGVTWIAVGDDGTIWACSEEGIFKKSWDDDDFEEVRGACVQLDVGSEEHVVCVNEAGKVYLWDGGNWHKIGADFKEVSIGNDGELIAISASSERPHRWDRESEEWVVLRGKLKHVAVGDAGTIMGVGLNNRVYMFGGSKWHSAEGFDEEIQHFSVSSDGTIFKAADNDGLFIHKEEGGFELLPGRATRVMAGSNMDVLCINKDDHIYHFQDGKWTRLPGEAISADIGDDGTIWAINPENKIFRWDGEDWEKMAGAADSISVGSVDNVACVNSHGRLYRFNGEKWKKLTDGGVVQASIGCDGDFWYLNEEGEIFRLDESGEEFHQYPGRAQHICCGDEDSILATTENGKAYRARTDGKEGWVKELALGGLGVLTIGSDGTICRVDDEDGIYALWGDDGDESSGDDSDGEPEDIEEVTEEIEVVVMPRRRNFAARRRMMMARSKKRQRQLHKAGGKAKARPTRAGYKPRRERKQKRRGRR